MDYGLVQSIQDTQNKLSHWDQNPVIVDPNNKDPNSVIDLCKAVGKNAETPPNAVNQPPMYPNDSQFQFDPTTFHGKDALAPLCSVLLEDFALDVNCIFKMTAPLEKKEPLINCVVSIIL